LERRIKVFALLVAHTEKSGVGIEWGSILGAFQWVLCQPPTKVMDAKRLGAGAQVCTLDGRKAKKEIPG